MTRRDLLRATAGALVAPVVGLLPKSAAVPCEPLGISYWLKPGPPWRNYTATYTNIDKAALIRKMREMHAKIKYIPPQFV
jgi:hypothetical protein